MGYKVSIFMVYTAADLQDFIKRELRDVNILVASKRQPWGNYRDEEGRIRWKKMPGGLVGALDPVMKACNGTWIASANTKEDFEVVDAYNRVQIPLNGPKYTLLRLWLRGRTDFSNTYLWFRFHNIPGIKSRYSENAFTDYLFDNREYGININQVVLQEKIRTDKKTLVDLHDYHLYLAGRIIKWLDPGIFTMHFNHIPWPPLDELEEIPHTVIYTIISFMLANDILGFQTEMYRENFNNAVEKYVPEARVDVESIVLGEHKTLTRVYPIGIDYDAIKSTVADKDKIEKEAKILKRRLGIKHQKIIVRWDRADPSKNIIDSLRAYEKFLDDNPEYRGEVSFIVIAESSRLYIKQYEQFYKELRNKVKEINRKYGSSEWKPVILLGHVNNEKLMLFCYMYDVHIVNSWRDGQHLGIKEGVAGNKGDGVVIVGNEVGAADQALCDGKGALRTYPRSEKAIEELAGLIKYAFEMPQAEREFRIANMKKVFEEENIYKWAYKRFSDAAKLLRS